MCGFWVTGLNIAVRSMISKPVRCDQLTGICHQKKMADMSRDRINTEAFFTFCSIDMFGPFMVKNGRKEMKRHGALHIFLADPQKLRRLTHQALIPSSCV